MGFVEDLLERGHAAVDDALAAIDGLKKNDGESDADFAHRKHGELAAILDGAKAKFAELIGPHSLIRQAIEKLEYKERVARGLLPTLPAKPEIAETSK